MGNLKHACMTCRGLKGGGCIYLDNKRVVAKLQFGYCNWEINDLTLIL